MASRYKNPRICLVPSDELRVVVLRLSEASGESMASVCASLLEESVPVLREMLAAFDAINANSDRARELLNEYGSAMKVAIDDALRSTNQSELSLPAVDHRRKHHKERARRASGT